MAELAAERYEVREVRRPAVRRAVGWVTAIASGLVTEGAHTTNPATRSWLVVDRASGAPVATVTEDITDASDTGALLAHDLNQMTAERFSQVWLQERYE